MVKLRAVIKELESKLAEAYKRQADLSVLLATFTQMVHSFSCGLWEQEPCNGAWLVISERFTSYPDISGW